MRILITLVLLALGGCTPPRDTFTNQLKEAVGKHDAEGVWKLVDHESRERILSGIGRSVDKAKKDQMFAPLFATMSGGSVDRAPEEIAVSFVAQQLATPNPGLSDDGHNPRVHAENHKWVAKVDPVGFVDPNGVPVSLWLRFSEPPQRSAQAGLSGLDVHVDRMQGHLDLAATKEEYAFAVKRMVELGGFSDEWLDATTKLINYYLEHTRLPLDVGFHIEKSGAVTPRFVSPDGRDDPMPQLRFGSWN